MSEAPKTDSNASLVSEASAVLSLGAADTQEHHLKQELTKAKLRQENLEKQLAETTRENRHLLARIRGYQTLSKYSYIFCYLNPRKGIKYSSE